MTKEFAVRIEFRRGDGRCYISSPESGGLHLAGPDIDALRNDLEPAIKDLVYHKGNYNVDIVGASPCDIR